MPPKTIVNGFEMKRDYTACLFLLLLFCQFPLFGVPKGSCQKRNLNETFIPSNSRLQVGANYTWVSIHPHGLDSFTGNLGGAQAIYEYRPMDCFYGSAKLAWREGKPSGHSGTDSFLYVDAQERFGYTFSLDDNHFLLTLYSGLGFRHYGQNQNPRHGSSIKFKYNEFYVPVGEIANYTVNQWFMVGLGFAWMPQIYPSVTVVPLKGARWVITNQLANFYVEMPFTFAFSKDKRFAFILNPFYEYWRDGHSTAKLSSGAKLGIPGNTYNFAGIDVNFNYCF